MYNEDTLINGPASSGAFEESIRVVSAMFVLPTGTATGIEKELYETETASKEAVKSLGGIVGVFQRRNVVRSILNP